MLMYGTRGEPLELQYETARGTGTLRQPFEGLVNSVERRYRETQSQSMREEYEQYMASTPARTAAANGSKRRHLPSPSAGCPLWDFCALPVTQALEFVDSLPSRRSARDMVVPTASSGSCARG